jgi:hypothetical protein
MSNEVLMNAVRALKLMLTFIPAPYAQGGAFSIAKALEVVRTATYLINGYEVIGLEVDGEWVHTQELIRAANCHIDQLANGIALVALEDAKLLVR